MPIPDKLAECDLLRLGSRLVVKNRLPIISFQKLWWQDHKADTDRRQQQSGKRTDINYALPTGKSEKRRGRFLEINKLVFEIVFDYQVMTLICIFQKLQAALHRHDLTPFCHVGRGNIDHVAVFITVMDVISIIPKNSASMNKRRGREGYLAKIRIHFMNKVKADWAAQAYDPGGASLTFAPADVEELEVLCEEAADPEPEPPAPPAPKRKKHKRRRK